jgi:alcohol dehydrogenase class IV
MLYNFKFPENIYFGNGTINTLPSVLGGKKNILLVVGRHLLNDGTANRITNLLQSFQIKIHSGINGEPCLEDVDAIISAGQNFFADAIVAVGGGSVIDAAKTAAALITTGDTTADYFFDRKKILQKGLCFIAAPTTSGTGAEITANAVLTDSFSLIKKSVKHPTMLADTAIIDPELTYTCSQSLTAASGMDALTQAIESYLSNDANTVTRLFAGKAAGLIIKNLPAAYTAPDEISRTNMAEGSMFGALAFSQSGLGAVHGIAHPLGSKFHVPHGLACAILLPVILRWNLPKCKGAMHDLAEICGFGSAQQFIAGIQKLNQQLQIPDSFQNFGLTCNNFSFIIDNCRSNSMQKNPRQLTDAEVSTILEELC